MLTDFCAFWKIETVSPAQSLLASIVIEAGRREETFSGHTYIEGYSQFWPLFRRRLLARALNMLHAFTSA